MTATDPPSVPKSPMETPAAREPPSGTFGKPKKWILWAGEVMVICGIVLGWYLGVQRPRAIDEEACEKAKKADSKGGWQAYLGKHPKGMCADQAREGMAAIERKEDKAACKRARKEDTEASWKAYLGEHPVGTCKAEAEKRLEEMAAAERERLAKIEAEKREAEEKEKRLTLDKAMSVKQPGKNLYWLRCPIGRSWTGSSCRGKTKLMKWYKARKACPKGYRLPTRQEFVALLGGCNADVRGGKRGRCNKCANSIKCRSMFIKDKRWYWSSSSYAADSSLAWGVGFSSGNVATNVKAAGNHVCCVRDGP